MQIILGLEIVRLPMNPKKKQKMGGIHHLVMQCNSSRGSQIRKKTLGRVQIRLLVLFIWCTLQLRSRCCCCHLALICQFVHGVSRHPPAALHFIFTVERRKHPWVQRRCTCLRRRLVADRLASGHWAGAAPGLALTRLARQPNFPGCSTPVEQEVDNGQKQKTNNATFLFVF